MEGGHFLAQLCTEGRYDSYDLYDGPTLLEGNHHVHVIDRRIPFTVFGDNYSETIHRAKRYTNLEMG